MWVGVSVGGWVEQGVEWTRVDHLDMEDEREDKSINGVGE